MNTLEILPEIGHIWKSRTSNKEVAISYSDKNTVQYKFKNKVTLDCDIEQFIKGYEFVKDCYNFLTAWEELNA